MHFGAIFRVATQRFGKESLFIEESPDESKDGQDGSYESPIRTECQRHSDEIYSCARNPLKIFHYLLTTQTGQCACAQGAIKEKWKYIIHMCLTA